MVLMLLLMLSGCAPDGASPTGPGDEPASADVITEPETISLVELCKVWVGGEIPAGADSVTFRAGGQEGKLAVGDCTQGPASIPFTIEELVPEGTRLLEILLVGRYGKPDVIVRGETSVTVDPGQHSAVHFRNGPAVLPPFLPPTPVDPRPTLYVREHLPVISPTIRKDLVASYPGAPAHDWLYRLRHECLNTVTVTAMYGAVQLTEWSTLGHLTQLTTPVTVTLLEGESYTVVVAADADMIDRTVAAAFRHHPVGEPHRAKYDSRGWICQGFGA